MDTKIKPIKYIHFNKEKIKQYCSIMAFFVMSVLYAKFFLRATGDGHPTVLNVIALSGLCALLFSSRLSFLLSLPFIFLLAIYAPVGFSYGYPSYQYIASLSATNVGESLEFLRLIPSKSYLYAIVIVVIPFFLYSLARRCHIQPWRNKCFVILLMTFSFSTSGHLLFITQARDSVQRLDNDNKALLKYANTNNWQPISPSSHAKYQDYFLIIGESARMDYFHVYGYPVANTPFLDSTKGTIVKGLKSADTYTIGSLQLMLTLGNTATRTPDYSLNLIDLANKAGFETLWLSNQGQYGEWDTPITSIAKKSTLNSFTKFQGYDEANVSDFVLLNKIKSLIAAPASKPRLFIIHTMGSHPHACARVEDMKDSYQVNNKTLSYIACYVSSIRKTDRFLQELHNIAATQNQGRSYSMLYFADHGLAHKDIDGVIQINNSYISKYHHDIPLVKISSDDDKRIERVSEKSGLMFINGLADWLGIYSSQIKHYDLFDGVSDSDDFGLKKQSYRIDDPAIDISHMIM